jgi:hypothetical protein
MRLSTANTPAQNDASLENASRQMSDCAVTLYNDLKEVLQNFGAYTTNLYNLMGLLQLDGKAHEKIAVLMTRHRVLENFQQQLLGEIWKFQKTLRQNKRKNDYGLLLLYESRLNRFYQDTQMLETALLRFELDYTTFITEMESLLLEKN